MVQKFYIKVRFGPVGLNNRLVFSFKDSISGDLSERMHSLKDLLYGFCLRRLKRWTRSGLIETVKSCLTVGQHSVVVSVGGYGPVDIEIRNFVIARGGKFVTYDIDPSHNPDILGDVTNIQLVLAQRDLTPDTIIALEVMEHVVNPAQAVASCYLALSEHSRLILSTPWIIPIHDRPHDYYRFTPAALRTFLKDFDHTSIFARGNFHDSIIAILLRGLFSGGMKGKMVMLVGLLISSLRRPPLVYSLTDSIDSCIGYVSISTKIK